MRLLQTLPVAVAFLPLALAMAGAVEISPIVISPILEVASLPRDVLTAEQIVTVRGIVIHADRAKREVILEDRGGGIVVDLEAVWADAAGGEEGIAVGEEIDVTGPVEPGDFSPLVKAVTIQSHGRQPLPLPRRCDSDQFFAGSDHCRLVEIEGVIEQVWHDGGKLLVEIETAGRLFTAELSAGVVEEVAADFARDPQTLVDTVVRVAGPVVTIGNTRGEILRPWLMVERAEWFAVLSAARTFTRSSVAIDAIGRFRPLAEQGHRVQTFGTVIHAVAGRTLHLQNGHHGVTVRIGAEAEGADERFIPGDQVEVAGFIDRSGHVASIRSAAVRRVGHGGAPEPYPTTPEAILRLNAAAAEGDARAEPGDYEGCLVRLGGHLIQSQPTASGGIFVLGCDGLIVNAEADAESFAALQATEPGSFVVVTGVAGIDWGNPRRQASGNTPRHVRVLLRDPGDLRVLDSPPWWNASRLSAVLLATAAILTTALGWVVSLRRQLAAQKRLLASEMRSRRDAAVEFEATLRERTRLAANLHDTLQQTIGGIGYQLDACLTADGVPVAETKKHVDVARRMVHYAATEVEGAVWAMRSLSLGGKPLEEALEDLVARISEGHDTRTTVAARGAFGDLPEFVAGNLLLIAQEAVHNALRHGKPAVIDLTLTADDDAGLVRLRVADNGRGFVVGKQSGAREGHFGLQGMRERAERLGGRIEITSHPGEGTIVEATVERRDYDGQLDTEPAPRETGRSPER